MMKIHREGRWIVVLTVLLLLALIFLAGRYLPYQANLCHIPPFPGRPGDGIAFFSCA